MNANQDRYARLAARLLAPGVAADENPADQRRDAVVAAMALAMAAKTRRRRALVATGVVAVAAAASIAFWVRAGRHDATLAVASLLTVETMTDTGIELVRGRAVQPMPRKGSLLAGDVVRSAEGSTATLITVTGTHLTLSPSAQVRIDQLSPSWRISVSRGQLQAQVAKLGASERFVVGLPDGEVEVRGTLFRVSVTKPADGCGSTATRSTVEVDEGTVAVRAAGKELLLHKGEAWASPCPSAAAADLPSSTAGTPGGEPTPAPRAPKAAPAPAPRTPPRALGTRGPATSAPAIERAPAPAPTPVSRLAEQNDLFSAAMAAERQGQHDEALGRLDKLLEQFPDGPLSESARAEKKRILSAQRAP